jgi:hypothetical protein
MGLSPSRPPRVAADLGIFVLSVCRSRLPSRFPLRGTRHLGNRKSPPKSDTDFSNGRFFLNILTGFLGAWFSWPILLCVFSLNSVEVDPNTANK